MKMSKYFSALSLLIAITMGGSSAVAQSSYQIKVLTVGSSAQYGVFAAAAYQLANGTGEGSAKHYTLKGGTNAWVNDSRSSGSTTVPNTYGNLWVVWSATTGDIWAYLTVDSVVGVRAFMAQPRATLGLATTLPAVDPSSPFTYEPVWSDGSADTALPSGAQAVLSGAAFTAANTDVRPEDGLYATERANTPINTTNWSGLGYGTSATQLVGSAIQSQVTSGTSAAPVAFAISGNDPFSSNAVHPWVTLPVGAAPIVFIANSTDSTGLGDSALTNITTAQALKLFSGTGCTIGEVFGTVSGATSSTPLYPFLREPLSGTMNTTEFSVFRPSPWTTSQEEGVLIGSTPPTGQSYNPLNLNCGATNTEIGKRQRGVGTGDIVKGVNAQADGIGYVFWSYEALNAKNAAYGGNIVNSSTNAVQVKYLTLNGYDPLYQYPATTAGAIPVCGSATNASFNCAGHAGSTYTNSTTTWGIDNFPTLRAGNYAAWSTYRVIGDATTTGSYPALLTNAQTLVTEAQAIVDSTLPDFVPFLAKCGSSTSLDEPGLSVYRQHFTITGIASAAADGTRPPDVNCSTGLVSRTLKGRVLGGNGTVSGTAYTEEGGDVGGTIVFTATGSDATLPGGTDSGRY